LLIDEFVRKYPGYRTVTVQSAFRYDHSEETVRDAVRRLQDTLPNTQARIFDEEETNKVRQLIDVFSTPYKTTVTQREGGRMPVADTIIEIADRFIPSHRERAGHVGQFGYARAVENAERVELPRAIKYVAGFMAVGVPPELIGLAKGLEAARERGLIDFLEDLLPLLRDDIARALRYVDEDSLEHFASTSEAWASIKQDVEAAAAYTGQKPGPRTPEDVRHLTHTRNFVELFKVYDHSAEMAEEMANEALLAGRRRQYLG
jgi:phosphoenolpyruvate carboxylase